jgi:hypothetical protein
VILRVTRKRHPATGLSEWWISTIEKSRKLNRQVNNQNFQLTDTHFSLLGGDNRPTADPQISNFNSGSRHQAVIQGDPLLTETGVGLFALVCFFTLAQKAFRIGDEIDSLKLENSHQWRR